MRAIAAVLVVCLFAGASVLAGVRLARRNRVGDPDWQRRWKLADRSTKRRVRKAVVEGRTLTDPGDAYLAVGVATQALRGAPALGGRGRWLHVGGALLAVILALTTGSWTSAALLVAAAAGAVATPVLIRKRRPRIEAALRGNREIARQAGLTPPAEAPDTLHPS
jgi:hypothetical protein